MAIVPGAGPTVLRRVLGAELRGLRLRAGYTPAEAARAVRGSASKISRMELGKHAIKDTDVDDLLVLYELTDNEERERLLEMARRTCQAGWWSSYGDVIPTWFEDYVGLEEAAVRVRTYEPHYVPGLLQTEEYAAAIISLVETQQEEIDRRVALRMTRQRRFRDGKLRVWAIVDEAVLYRMVGGPDVMRAQLEYLATAVKIPNLTVQVMPYEVGGYMTPGAFSVLRFAEDQVPDVIYIEQLTNAVYIDKHEDVDSYNLVMERLSVLSAPGDESVEIISRALDRAR